MKQFTIELGKIEFEVNFEGHLVADNNFGLYDETNFKINSLVPVDDNHCKEISFDNLKAENQNRVFDEVAHQLDIAGEVIG